MDEDESPKKEEESKANTEESSHNPYESNPYETQNNLSMTLKNGGGLGATMSDTLGKTIKGNSNIFGIETKTDESSKYKEFDDLDDDDERDDGSDEEPNHDSPAGKAHDKANAVMA